MSPRIYSLFLFAVAGAFLPGCNLGTAVKTLGPLSTGLDTGNGNTDAFAITLAYRDPSSDTAPLTPIRTVVLQGIQGIPSANLVNVCGATGSGCTCQFFTSTSDPSPKAATAVGISQQNNSYSCTIPSSITDAQLRSAATTLYVQLTLVSSSVQSTGLISVVSNLKIEDVLGTNLTKTKVRGVFRYNCNRTFFEGEGVTAGQVLCVNGQHLGLIGAAYNFYTYRSLTDQNQAGGDSPFPTDICQRNNFLKIQCTGNTPDLRFGLYMDKASPFDVAITMTRAPEGDNLTAIYGYAAQTDSGGNCPAGLIKIRPWQAQPASIVQGSLGSNPPSSFINSNNSLNNTIVEQSANQPANFIVTRQPNQTACDGTGNCTNASFGGTQQAESVAYTAMSPVVCAIPPALMSGLF